MKNWLKKLANAITYIIVGGALFTGISVYALNVSVPAATQKGDLPTGLTTGNYQLLHPGSNGTVLTASSTSANGLTWAASTGGGQSTSTIISMFSAASPVQLSATSGLISILQASGSQNGYLSSTDWTTFNGKQAALTLPLSVANGGTGTSNGSISGTGSVLYTTSGTSLTLQETGDTFGTVSLALENRSGTNGALFTNSSLDLVDFGFVPNSGIQNNIRLEHRSANLIAAGNTRGEFEFFDPVLGGGSGTAYFVTGVTSTVVNVGKFGVGTTTPGNAVTVVGSISSSALTSGNCVQAGAGGVLTTVGAACGSGGSGNSAWTIGTNLIYNATSTDSVLVGTSTPVTSTFFVQGTGSKQALTVASSSGISELVVASDGSGSLYLPQGGNRRDTLVGVLTGPALDYTPLTSSFAYIFPVTTLGYDAGHALVASTTAACASATNGCGPYGTTALGSFALSSCIDCAETTAVGSFAGNSATGTSFGGTFIGMDAGRGVLTGTGNTALGNDSMLSGSLSNLTGSGNTALGYQSGINFSGTSANNTFVGANSGSVAGGTAAISSGDTVVGQATEQYFATSSFNTIMGWQAAQGTATQTGASISNNSIFGVAAAHGLTTGGSNTVMGENAAYQLTTGSNNIILGGNAGNANVGNGITTGSNNIIIGYNIDAVSNTSNSQLNIGNIIYGTTISGSASTISPGNIGIGSSTPGSRFTVQGSTSTPTSAILTIASSTGTNLFSVSAAGDLTAGNFNWVASSRTLNLNGGGIIGGSGNLAINPVSDINLEAGGSLKIWDPTINNDAVLNVGSLTGAKTFTFPNQTGTFALGTGTNGQDAYWNATNVLTSSSDFLNNGTVVGVNATSSTVNLNVQGTGSLAAFNVASSSGQAEFTVNANNNIVFQNEVLPTFAAGTQKFFTVVGSQAGGVARVVRDVGLGILSGTAYGTYDITAYSATTTIDFPNLTGPYQTFSIATGTMQNIIGQMGVLRDGNDTTGTFNFQPLQSGSVQAGLTISGNSASSSFTMQAASSATTVLRVNDSSANALLIVLATGKVGIGTTSPSQLLTVGNNNQFTVNTASIATSPTASILALASSTGTTLFSFDGNGHHGYGGTAPVLSSCGTSPSLSSDATDDSGTITVGSVSATACTLTFAAVRTNSPHCNITNQSMSVVNAMTYTESTTNFVVSMTGLTGDKLDYNCTGN